MKIGELAKKAGCQVETVRYYEREGLLPAPARSEGNYRLYGAPHLERLLGGKTPVARVTTAIIQHYVDRRAAEKYRSKPIKPQTIKKEVATLLTVWNWAARRDHVAAPCSTKGITFPKEKEKPQFRTFDQVKAIVARGGLSKTEIRELWDGLFLSKDEVAEVLAHARENAGSE